MIRLELRRPWTGVRIPAYIEQGQLFSQCGTVAPGVEVLIRYDGTSWEGQCAAQEAAMKLLRMGYNPTKEPLP